MPFPTPVDPNNEFANVVQTLLLYTAKLPSNLPAKDLDTSQFAVFARDLEKDKQFLKHLATTECSIAALSRMLKDVFGWETRSQGDGCLRITERGPGIEAMSNVLVAAHRCAEKDMVIRKWIVDIANAMECVFEQAGHQVSNKHVASSLFHSCRRGIKAASSDGR